MKGFKAKYWAIPLILTAIVGFAFKDQFLPAGKAQSQLAATKGGVSVSATPAAYISTVPKLVLTGSLEGQTSAAISAKISGRIQEVLVEDGQKVVAGQALVRLESTELANSARIANDSVNKAQANYDNAKADYDRYYTLFEKNAVSKQQLDSIETKLKIAQAELSSAAASLGNANQQFESSEITAPVAGVIANKAATVGQVVAAGAVLMNVENIDSLYAVVNIEQKDLSMVQTGSQAKVLVDTYPDKAFTGVVETINPVAGATSRMFRTKIRLDNSESLLKPGMFIKVELATGAEAQVLTVPQSAIFQKQGLYYVYTAENNKAVRRQIEVGELHGNAIEVKKGLDVSQPVIINNVTILKDGDPVQVTN